MNTPMFSDWALDITWYHSFYPYVRTREESIQGTKVVFLDGGFDGKSWATIKVLQGAEFYAKYLAEQSVEDEEQGDEDMSVHNTYAGVSMPQITRALREIAEKHQENFWEVRELVQELVQEQALRNIIEYYRKESQRNRSLIVVWRHKHDEEWATHKGVEFSDGCIVLDRLVAAGPIFFNNRGCLFKDFKGYYTTADIIKVIYLDTEETHVRPLP